MPGSTRRGRIATRSGTAARCWPTCCRWPAARASRARDRGLRRRGGQSAAGRGPGPGGGHRAGAIGRRCAPAALAFACAEAAAAGLAHAPPVGSAGGLPRDRRRARRLVTRDRRRPPPRGAPTFAPPASADRRAAAAAGEPVEAVILRRGSSRRFSHAAISREQFETSLAAATSPFATTSRSRSTST